MTDLDGATEPGLEHSFPADAGEFAARWNARTPESREDLVRVLVSNAQIASTCIIRNHEARFENVNTALRQVRDELRGLLDRLEDPVVAGDTVVLREAIANVWRMAGGQE